MAIPVKLFVVYMLICTALSFWASYSRTTRGSGLGILRWSSLIFLVVMGFNFSVFLMFSATNMLYMLYTMLRTLLQ